MTLFLREKKIMPFDQVTQQRLPLYTVLDDFGLVW